MVGRLMLCTICHQEAVTSTDPECDWCVGCHYTGRWIERNIDGWLRYLANYRHMRATIEHLGGGIFVLEVPIAENPERWMWLGLNDDSPNSEWMLFEHAPQPGEWIGGYVYEAAGPPDAPRDTANFHELTPREVVDATNQGSGQLIVDLALEAMTIPTEELEVG